MRVRVLVCLIMACMLLTSCGNSKSDAKYEELKAEYKALLEEYEILEQEQKDLESQFDQLVTEKEMMQLMLNAQGNGNKVEIFEDDKEPETIPGVEFMPVYKNASISLSDQAKELLQTSYNDIEAIDEYSDTIYEVGTIFGNRKFTDSGLPHKGKFKYAITNVIVGEEAARLQQFAQSQLYYDTTNEMIVCFEVCIALDEEFSLGSTGEYRHLCCPLEVYNLNGDNSSKKTCSFSGKFGSGLYKYFININKPKAGEVLVLYQFARIPKETKEFTVFTQYDYMNVHVEDWK